MFMRLGGNTPSRVFLSPNIPRILSRCKAAEAALQRKMENKYKNKHWPSAAFSLLEGKLYTNKRTGSKGRRRTTTARGHSVPIVIRYQTVLRTGSGERMLSERFEEFQKWVPNTERSGVRS